MTFIEKVKESVELATGCRFFYHAAGELNEVLAGVEIGDEPISFAYLLKGGEVAVGKNCREGVNLAVFFCKKTEFDFNSYENEQLIDECKQIAFGWVSLFSKSNTLEIVGNVTTERVYDTTTDILTGIAVNITLRELVGYGMCDIKKPVLIIEKNGVYTFGAYDVKVDVAQLGWKLVFNDGFVGSLYVKKLWSNFKFDKCNFLSELDTSKYKIDTSSLTDMTLFFGSCLSLKSVDLSGIDTSNVTNMNNLFRFCRSLETLDLSNFDTSNVTSMNSMFNECEHLSELDLSNFDTSKVTSMNSMFWVCLSLIKLDLSSFDTSNVTNMSYMFWVCGRLRTIIGNHNIEEVEGGSVIAMKGTKVDIPLNSSSFLRYSSMLAATKGLADLTGKGAKTISLNVNSWNNMRNDDDTIPDADTIAERQARLSAIAAQKNWNIAH